MLKQKIKNVMTNLKKVNNTNSIPLKGRLCAALPGTFGD